MMKTPATQEALKPLHRLEATARDAHAKAGSAYARRHPAFWQGRLEAVQTAMLRRRIESSYGWPLRISHSPNQRSLLNFPMQSDGAEMLREATVRLCDAGIVPIMLVHDGRTVSDALPARR